MKKTIPYLSLKLILFLVITGCEKPKNSFKTYDKGIIEIPSGEKITTYIALSPSQQSLGLSHVRPTELDNNEAMIFLDEKDSHRQFWMPETFMNLDIYFLTKDLYVIDVHRNVPHFKKSRPKSKIPLSKTVFSRHVLEVKTSSPLNKKIKPGMILKWKSRPLPSQIKLNIHYEK